MKKKKWNRVLAVLLAMVTAVSLLSACGSKSAKKEDAETITVYLWSTNLYEKYAPYIQEQLPDINVEFVVGNNDLDFYKFLVALSPDHPGAVPGVSRQHRVFCPGTQHPQSGGCGLALSGAAFGCPSAPGAAGRH